MENTDKKTNIIPMSKAAKKRISKIVEEAKGTDLFPEKNKLAEKTLQYVNSLPM